MPGGQPLAQKHTHQTAVSHVVCQYNVTLNILFRIGNIVYSLHYGYTVYYAMGLMVRVRVRVSHITININIPAGVDSQWPVQALLIKSERR